MNKLPGHGAVQYHTITISNNRRRKSIKSQELIQWHVLQHLNIKKQNKTKNSHSSFFVYNIQLASSKADRRGRWILREIGVEEVCFKLSLKRWQRRGEVVTVIQRQRIPNNWSLVLKRACTSTFWAWRVEKSSDTEQKNEEIWRVSTRTLRQQER